MVLSQFKRAFRRRFDSADLLVKHEGLMDSDAWEKFIESAEMTALEIKRFGLSSDRSHPMAEKTVGKIVTQVKPNWGEKKFPRRLRDAIIDGDVRAQELVGMPALDADEVEAVLEDGNQQRRLLIGQAAVPILAYPIAEDRDERPADAQVYAAMEEKVSEVNGKLGLKLPYDWKAGQWSDEALSVKLDAIRDS
ncbi:hypothetical protein SAMN05421630_106111 [Prauserella marina]|uniref:Uncharacterized protein n=2 Tax=Prauserella marina TaxID=530584 RepID=A0A1G6SCP0_9PSEU|nr:hypothetical protein DES30_102111 [Prauserella marina]SDD14424.1 hypothetical protein SAMN05421630_106111 [Prauserella marina]